MKVVLKISTGEIVATKELVGLLEFPGFIFHQGHLYKRVEQSLSEATYQWEPHLHI
ncbi:MAG: hypothetical protein RM049_07505 [Nostoc sp. DedQUE04]|uniref:hypothetical protein n=1 Tax=Nostoc sp. DedQUE04 TaxID=3075390 RepID=UPI002AD48AB9|nr:hypothetical protein [Nostoc sp. DedQUE04]MDZ8135136.1 hypothetical protein [Nostoc sp. DedQUE04]